MNRPYVFYIYHNRHPFGVLAVDIVNTIHMLDKLSDTEPPKRAKVTFSFEVAGAVCSPDDQFVRRVGKSKALGRLKSNKDELSVERHSKHLTDVELTSATLRSLLFSIGLWFKPELTNHPDFPIDEAIELNEERFKRFTTTLIKEAEKHKITATVSG